MPDAGTPPELSSEQADATIRSKQFVGLLVIVALIGILASLAAWCFLELVHQIQQELYVHLPSAVGYSHGPPKWWSLPILAIAALIVALAITRLPGNGGHVPAEGLSTAPAGGPRAVPGIALAGLATIGGPRLRLILVPGLLAAGIGTLVSLGIGSFTGLSPSAYALPPLHLAAFGHLDIGQFGWTIALAVAIALVTSIVVRGGLLTYHFVSRRSLIVLLPIVGLIIGGLAIAFSQATGKSVNEVLFSGQDALPGLASQPGTWSLAALAWLIAFKGIAYGLSLGSFRGGPTFPALFLGAAAGVMASHLPGFPLQPAIAVGMGAATVVVLKLPLSAVVLATLLTAKAGPKLEPLIIVGVVVSYIVTLLMTRWLAPASEPAPHLAPEPG